MCWAEVNDDWPQSTHISTLFTQGLVDREAIISVYTSSLIQKHELHLLCCYNGLMCLWMHGIFDCKWGVCLLQNSRKKFGILLSGNLLSVVHVICLVKCTGRKQLKQIPLQFSVHSILTHLPSKTGCMRVSWINMVYTVLTSTQNDKRHILKPVLTETHIRRCFTPSLPCNKMIKQNNTSIKKKKWNKI